MYVVRHVVRLRDCVMWYGVGVSWRYVLLCVALCCVVLYCVVVCCVVVCGVVMCCVILL